MADNDSTPPEGGPFDFEAFPADTCFHERRTEGESAPKRDEPSPARDRTLRKERRRRIDPTTFEKQYSTEELDFMNAMQRFKLRSGKAFPAYGDVLKVARDLGYQRSPDEGPADGRTSGGESEESSRS